METTTVEPLLQFCYDNVFETNISVDYIHWFLIPAVAIMLILCFMEKRKTFKPNIMGGRPAVVRPLGFLDEPANRWGVMFVFGSVTGNVIQMAQKAVSDELNWPIWARIFMVYILCLETSVVCYPLFACMTTRHKLVGAIAGLLYSLGWFTLEMVRNVAIGICFVKYVDPQRDVKMSAHILIQEMPVTICNFLVVLKFCWKLYKCLRKGIYKIGHEEHVKLCKSYHLTYVKHLLNKRSMNNTNETLTWKQKIHQKIIRPVPGFRFPISITITSFMSGVLLYMVGLYCAQVMESQSKTTYFIDFVDLIKAANVIATMITLLCGIRNIYILLMNYRRDMLLLFKGDKSFIPNTVQTPSPNVYMAQGMRFIGTSITGMFWGTVFCYLLVFVPLALMFMIIKILNLRKELDEMWKQFQWLIYPICMVIIFKVQTFLIGRYFIQPKINAEDKYRPLAVDNRNIYDVFSFFTIFLNASIGLFTFLKRILLGAFLGVFMIPRMDRSLLMRGYEAMDKCYVNYIGMIMVDVAHNHPVMRVFCFLVKSNLENRRDRKPLRSAVENAVYGNLSFSNHIPIETGNSIAKRRWWLALTLIRNPSLVALRVRESKREPRHRTTLSLTDIKCDDKTAIVDQENSADAWGFSIRCCRKYKFEIPSNILINLMALIVLLSVLVVYTGFPILLTSLMEEAEALAQAP